jgi:hypothetical protein
MHQKQKLEVLAVLENFLQSLELVLIMLAAVEDLVVLIRQEQEVLVD